MSDQNMSGQTIPSTAQDLLAETAQLLAAHDLEGAELKALEALTQCEAAHGRRSLSVALCLSKLGHVYEQRAHFAKATRVHGEACVIRQGILGKHADTALSLNDYGATLMADGQWGQAMEGLNMALVMYKKLNMLESPEAHACRKNMAACKEAAGCSG
ncbi:MAG: hypothetical protein R3Y11_11970 [Pseudomonadota bacterium]